MKTTVNGKECTIEFKTVTEQDSAGIEEIKQLFWEYAQSLEIDLGFQDFDTEFRTLPGNYAEPDGALLLALVDGQAAGCIALRKIGEGICEMKRLYVREAYRGLKMGKKLIARILEEASQRNYDYMRLDTLATMTRAYDLYRSFGFYEIAPYVYNPIPGAIFMERPLKSV